MTTTLSAATPRSIALAALLATLQPSQAFAAGELFRWTEPDGSLTFSPTPPIDGTPFTAVDPASLRPTEESPREESRNEESRSEDEERRRTAATSAPMPPAVGRAFPPAGSRTSDVPADVPASAAFENERCTELSKRVVSLEQRLTAKLTPQEMDDTVIRMARYQQNFENLCR